MRRKWVLWLGLGVALLAYWIVFRARRKSDYPVVGMAAALAQMKTGDLILFSKRFFRRPANYIKRAKHLSLSYVVRSLYGSEWGHVGVVFREPNGRVLLVHCDMRNGAHADVFCGSPKDGVQAVDLESKVRNYPGY